MAKNSELKKSMYKSGTLFIGIVVLLFLGSKMDSLTQFADSVLGENSGSISSYNDSKKYDEISQNLIQNSISGLWAFDSKSKSGLIYHDRMELKSNGIIWRYEEFTFPFPYGEALQINRASNAYILPFAPSTKDSLTVVSNLRTIRESWMGKDSCQGNSFVDELWETKKVDDKIIINSREYDSYKGDTAKFFPLGTVEIVDDVSVIGCENETPFLDWKRKHIISRVTDNQFISEEIGHEQFELLRSYYYPYCFVGVGVEVPLAVKTPLELSFFVDISGKPADIHISGKVVASTYVKNRLIEEVGKWKFPTNGDSSRILFKAIW
jgi:hypothetical protein